MKRRVLTTVLAVLLAVLGTAGVLAYVHQADSRALAGLKTVTTLVATAEIPSGTTASDAVSQGLLTRQRLPASAVPADAVRSLDSSLNSLVTGTDLQAGQLLTRPMLVTTSQVAGGLAVPKGMVAVSIALCVPEAVAGNISAGAHVSIYNTWENSAKVTNFTAGPNCAGPHQQQAYGFVHTQLVLSSVKVLSVGQAPAPTTGPTPGTGATQPSQTSSQNSQLLTLAATPANATKLIEVAEAGLPYVVLLPASSTTGVDTTRAP